MVVLVVVLLGGEGGRQLGVSTTLTAGGCNGIDTSMHHKCSGVWWLQFIALVVMCFTCVLCCDVLCCCRYASMKLVQQMPGGENIKAFTRIMHRTTDDDLVGEVRAMTD